MSNFFHLFPIFLIIVLSACSNKEQNKSDTSAQPSQFPEVQISELTFELVSTEQGWGYNILRNGQLFIRQHTIPSVSGNRSFDTKEKAQKAAELVLDKIKRGQMPPSVSTAELDSLGLL